MLNTTITPKKRLPAALVLEDGSVYHGRAFGAVSETGGEVVFNTSMTGYQEILTDPSYHGQIVTMTYPLIGNYGVNQEDVESKKIQVSGFIVKELSLTPSNWRHDMSLEEWMQSQNIVGLCGIDTRALVRKLRNYGVMRGVICLDEGSEVDLLAKVDAVPQMAGADLAIKVTTDKPYVWNDRLHPYHKVTGMVPPECTSVRVVAMDFGIKYNILCHLAERVSEVHVLPATATADEVMALEPDGIFLSNGPGDPEPVTYAIETVRNLLGQKPIFGICLGHQILGLALGGKTYKLKFGHRGANQPVQHIESGKIDITSQNHGFCLDMDGFDPDRVRVTHINLNDRTVEGLECEEKRCFSVQYHPEASPGPHDSTHHFDKFIAMMREQ